MEYREYLKISNKLKECRRARGLRQRDVAKLLNLKSPSRISRWETGECLPSVQNMLALAQVYHVICDDLFWGLREAITKEIMEGEEKMSEKSCNIRSKGQSNGGQSKLNLWRMS